MTVLARLAALLALVSFPLVAGAEMYKCKQPDGSAAYQDHPCAEGRTKRC
jgi:hypothetical protein